MGTNYYLIHSHLFGSQELHIGKSSYGWCFALRVYPEKSINDLDDWLPLFNDKRNTIRDEYGSNISPEEMLSIITDRSGSKVDWDVEKLARNSAELGPNNLVRAKVDGVHCIGHGAGTWDLFACDFS